MEIREKIQQKCERIAANIADHGRSEEEREAAMQEAYGHRDDLTWLVSRIESLGWEVTLKRKTTD